jgi:hypothetical protein
MPLKVINNAILEFEPRMISTDMTVHGAILSKEEEIKNKTRTEKCAGLEK